MIVVDDHSEATINYEAAKALNPSENTISDVWRGYRGLTKVIGGLKQRVTPPEKPMEYLLWVHTVISNAKKMTTYRCSPFSFKHPHPLPTIVRYQSY